MEKSNNRAIGVKVVKINTYGVNTIMKIMRDYKLNYDCNLFSITSVLEHRVPKSKRELQEIETTKEIIKIVNHIKNNDLLKKGVVLSA